MKHPNFKEEKKIRKKGFRIIVGLDEAGRGPLAGPVVACAVMLLNFKLPGLVKLVPLSGTSLTGQIPHSRFKRIKDSKKLTPQKREEWYKILTTHPDIQWATSRVSEKVIDKINILEATRLAMKKAVLNLSRKTDYKPDFLIIDGNSNLPKIKIPQKCIIKADEKVISCVIASIISKVKRDRIMERYHKLYPKYGFDKHKGYPTKKHRQILKKYGTCKIHRQSFKPVLH